MERGEAVCRPRDGIRFPGAGAVLDEVIAPRAVLPDVRDELAHDIELVEAREDQRFLSDLFFRAVRLRLLFLRHLKMDELLHDIHHAVRLKDRLPQIVGGISAGILRIAFSAVVSGAVAALIERQEEGLLAVEARRHPHRGEIDAEIPEDAAVEAEAGLFRVAVLAPLTHCVLDVLSLELVLQFEGEQRDAVDPEEHVHAQLFRFSAVMPLADAVEDVLPVVRRVRFVETGFRHEITDAEGDPAVLEAVAQDVQHAVHIACVIERETEFLFGIGRVHVPEALPRLRLGPLNEVDQRPGVERKLRIVRVRRLRIPARGGDEERLDVALKALFSSVKNSHSSVPRRLIEFFTISMLTFWRKRV